MYKIKINNFPKKYLLAELINIFIMPSEYQFIEDGENLGKDDIFVEFNKYFSSDKDEIKREIYNYFYSETKGVKEWGILTGIRPVKLCGELLEELGTIEDTKNYLKSYYLLSDNKIDMILDTYLKQRETIGFAEEKSLGLYIGIPFCPTRCVYCSFASNQVEYEKIREYVRALSKEIDGVSRLMKETGFYPETIYIGGGTPTSLNSDDLKFLLDKINNSFDMKRLREFSLEAGRPDTIDYKKLRVMKDYGVERISINPQSMVDRTLELIGRSHGSKDIEEAFALAREFNFNSINADVIAGLPEESLDDFRYTLEKVMSYGADNITVHSLAVKRASKLVDIDANFHYKQGELVKTMVEEARKVLSSNSYRPYYLYRQKHMSGACENIGYCKDEKYGIYNMRIMDEHQNIVALGAGGISKAYFPKENRLERVPNVTNYEEYIKRVDEMIKRKEKNLFLEVIKWQ